MKTPHTPSSQSGNKISVRAIKCQGILKNRIYHQTSLRPYRNPKGNISNLKRLKRWISCNNIWVLSSDIAGRSFKKIVSPFSPPKRSLRQSPACLCLWSHAEFPNSSLGKALYKLSSLLFTRERRASSCPSAWCPPRPRGLVSLRDRAVHLRVHLGSREPFQSLLFSDSIPQKSRTVQVSNFVLG